MNKIVFKNISLGQVVLWVVMLALGVSAFFFVRDIVTCWVINPLPGKPPADCGTVTAGIDGPVIEVNDEGTPVATSEIPPPPPVSIPDSNLPPAWDGASRVTVLLIGLDHRDWLAGEGAPRSDSLIVLTIDPISKTAGMLSIPRDMWVNIPGFWYSRINTAYSLGEGSKLPGGGPELARKTVEQFLGVPIQYYAQIDFQAFVEFIDLIGGIWVYNDEELRLDPVGPGLDKIRLTCCGDRHLNGRTALAYARYRKGEGGDVARAKRQQKVILGIRNQIMDPQNFPVLLGKARQFYEEFSAGIKTNMPFDTAIQLGVFAKDIPVENIKQGVIDYTMVSLENVVLGGENASVVKPLPDKIRILVEEIFISGGPTSPLAAQGDPATLMKADGARIRVLNGSTTPGLEINTANYLLQYLGMAVTNADPADRIYDRTIIVLHSPKLYTLKFLQTVFGVSQSTQILIKPDAASPWDVEIYLGNDWALNNTLP